MSDFLGDDDAFDEDEPTQRPARPPRPQRRTANDGSWSEDDVPIVLYLPPRCPTCRSREKLTTGGYPQKRKRYHVCKRCGCYYHSIEITEEDLET